MATAVTMADSDGAAVQSLLLAPSLATYTVYTAQRVSVGSRTGRRGRPVGVSPGVEQPSINGRGPARDMSSLSPGEPPLRRALLLSHGTQSGSAHRAAPFTPQTERTGKWRRFRQWHGLLFKKRQLDDKTATVSHWEPHNHVILFSGGATETSASPLPKGTAPPLNRDEDSLLSPQCQRMETRLPRCQILST